MAADLVVRILTDASSAETGIGKFQSSLNKLTGPALAVVGGVAAIGTVAVKAASDAEQAMGGVDAVFGESAGQVKAWAAEAATAVGLTKAEYGNFAAVIGAQLKNLGVPMDQVAGQTDEMIKLGADLAATYGGTTADAVSALSSALRGEADPAERYGLALNQTAVNAQLASQGLTGLEGEALTAAKAQAIMAMATEQAGGAVGQFGRESDTVSGQTQIMQAQVTDAAAAMGEDLLPVIAPVIGALADMAKWVGQNARVIMPLILVVGALAAGILALNVAISAGRAIMTAWTAIQKVVTAAQWLWNAAMSANPIGIIIMAVAALVAAFIYLWNTNEGFRDFFIGLWKSISAFFTKLWDGMLDVVGAVVSWFQDAWAAVAGFFEKVWKVAVALVMAYFNAYRVLFTAIFNAVKVIAQAVASFFADVWRNAVNAVQAVFRTLSSVVGSVASFFASAWQGAVNAVASVINWLGSVFSSVMNAVLTPIRWVVDAFNNVVSAIQNVISWLGRIKIPDVFGAIGDLVGGAFGASASAAAPAGFAAASTATASMARTPRLGASAGLGGGGGGLVNIYVSGSLDGADTTARRIRAILDGREHRTRGVVLTRRTVG